MNKKLFLAVAALAALTSCASPAETSTSREVYEVTFVNYDGTTLYVDHVEAGNNAVYKGERPEKPRDSYTIFTFDGWDGELSNITKDSVFTAVFSESTETSIFRFSRSIHGDSYLLKGFKEENVREEITELFLPTDFNGFPVLMVGDMAFYECPKLEKVVIPEGITSLNDTSFGHCEVLSSVSLPSSLRTIYAGAFSGCKGITKITIPEGVEYLGSYAFGNCIGLRSVELPSTLSRIDGSCFGRCNSLESIEVSAESEYLSSEKGILYSRDGKKLLCYPSAGSEEINIRDGVESIAPYALCGLTENQSIKLPNSLKAIEPNALIDIANDHLLKSYRPLYKTNKRGGGMYIGSDENPFMALVGVSDSASGNFTVVDGCRFVSDRVLTMNDDIVAVALPEGLVSIGWSSFSYCNSLLSVNLPNTIKRLDDFALASCPNLCINGEFPESLVDIGRGSFTPSDSGFEGRVCPTYATASENGCYVGPVSNPYRFFLGPTSTSLTSYEVDAMTESIAGRGFYGCSAATSISIPDRVTRMADSCFYGCSSLAQLRLPMRLETIPSDAFRDCSGLSELAIPKSVRVIGEWAFSGTFFQGIDYAGTREEFLSILKHPGWTRLSNLEKVICNDGELPIFLAEEE